MRRKSGSLLTNQSSRPGSGSGLPSILGYGRRSRWDLLALVPIALVAFALVAVAHPPRSGPLALALMLEPHVFIVVLVVLAPIALLARTRTLSLALVVTLVAGGWLFGSEWISLPGSGAGRHDLSVMTWNLQSGARTPAETAAQLKNVTVDLVALQEIEPDASAAIESDSVLTARYPYRAMTPGDVAFGVSILSRYPIENVVLSNYPACLELTVDTPRGPVRVINAHPSHAEIDTVSRRIRPVGSWRGDRQRANANRRSPGRRRPPPRSGRLQHLSVGAGVLGSGARSTRHPRRGGRGSGLDVATQPVHVPADRSPANRPAAHGRWHRPRFDLDRLFAARRSLSALRRLRDRLTETGAIVGGPSGPADGEVGRVGSGGRIRTYGQAVNSRPLYH
jgi:endonuclease/exonuclease/phosphatase (EEP) superfamily protein YafD